MGRASRSRSRSPIVTLSRRSGRRRSRDDGSRETLRKRDRGDHKDKDVVVIKERSRSRSRDREGRRTTGRDSRRRRDDRRKSRSRSKSRDREGRIKRRKGRDSRSRSKDHPAKGEGGREVPEIVDLEAEVQMEADGKTEEEIQMMRMMGFGGFETTKGKKVQGDVGAVHHVQVRKYRQYMNRRGGFNRPLDAVH